MSKLVNQIVREFNPKYDRVNYLMGRLNLRQNPAELFDEGKITCDFFYFFANGIKAICRGGLLGAAIGYSGQKFGFWDTDTTNNIFYILMSIDNIQYFSRTMITPTIRSIFRMCKGDSI